MTEIYLGLWKNLSYLEPIERAAIVLALKPICVFVILLLVFLLRSVLVNLFFIIINKFHEIIPSRKSFEARAASSNRISEHYEIIYAKMKAIHTKCWIVRILVVIIAYYMLRVAVVVYAPKIAGTGDQTYLGSFIISKAEKYQEYEEKMLQKANGYQPLIPVDSQTVQIEEVQHEKKIWLSLSKKGRKGVAVKKKPSKKSKKIAHVSGKDKVKFLSKNKKGWVKIQLKNGKKGWIKQVFLKGIPG